MNIEINTQASIKLSSNKIIYIDPYKIENSSFDADYIFITHDHYDHFDDDSIKKIIKNDTTLIVPISLIEKVSGITKNIIGVVPNKKYTIEDITFETVPAYNISKSFHPKEQQYVGYNITIDNIRYYIMGDTDVTLETQKVKTDVCFVPIGGTYTMNVEEAAKYINELKPKIAIPIHYGSIVGDKNLKDKFVELVDKKIEVHVFIK